MSVNRIASRYAKSLIDLALERKELDTITKDVEQFQAATQNRDFRNVLRSPIINTDKKQAIVNAIFEDKIGEVMHAFLRIVLNKGREEYLPQIADAYMRQYKQLQNIATVKLRTAQPVTPVLLEQVRAELAASGAVAPNVEIETSVEPDLIGGYVLEFGDNLYDASVAHQLDELRKEFNDTSYQRAY